MANFKLAMWRHWRQIWERLTVSSRHLVHASSAHYYRLRRGGGRSILLGLSAVVAMVLIQENSKGRKNLWGGNFVIVTFSFTSLFPDAFGTPTPTCLSTPWMPYVKSQTLDYPPKPVFADFSAFVQGTTIPLIVDLFFFFALYLYSSSADLQDDRTIMSWDHLPP